MLLNEYEIAVKKCLTLAIVRVGDGFAIQPLIGKAKDDLGIPITLEEVGKLLRLGHYEPILLDVSGERIDYSYKCVVKVNIGDLVRGTITVW